jgi:phospholipid/cholesterol/gamma-HCH transport system substrate-binding protein
MKHSREIKVGILAVVCAGILYFGFNFLKGVNIFSPTDCYYGYFERSNGLTEQAPVYILGHKVGLVESIKYDFTRTPAFFVGVNINNDITLPIGTEMALVADGLLGGSAIELILPTTHTRQVYQEGDVLTTKIVAGLMDDLQKGILASLDSVLVQADLLLANLNNEIVDGSLQSSLENIEQITSDLKVSGKDIRLLTNQQLPGIINRLDTTLTEVQYIVTNVKDANVQNTLNDLNETIKTVNQLLQSDNGTIGLLLNDTELHDNLNTALKNLDNALLNVDTIMLSIKERPFIKKKLPKKD